MEPDTPGPRGNTDLELAIVEGELARVWARWERTIEQIGGAVPPCQLRAVLLIDDAGVLPPGRLAVALGLSASRTNGPGACVTLWRTPACSLTESGWLLTAA